jgi:5-methylcytosine-specific restriction protein B
VNLNEQFQEYKSYVENTLNQYPVDHVKIKSIAVFKALAELTLGHATANSIINREDLQQHVNQRYTALSNERRQEVNKYLSQRYRATESLEPNFIAFTLIGSDELFTRKDDVEGGSTKAAYQIIDFDDKDKLIEFLYKLDLTLFYIEPSTLCLPNIIKAYHDSFQLFTNNKNWYDRYRIFVDELTHSETLSDQDLKRLWCNQEIGVALIKQAITPKKEFENAKGSFKKITLILKDTADPLRYEKAITVIDKANDADEISRRYFAVLNRAAVVFDSKHLTFPVDVKVMKKLCEFLNEFFELNIVTHEQNWFELSQSIKKAFTKCFDESIDPLQMNIIIWRINEQKERLRKMLKQLSFDQTTEEEKQNKGTIMVSPLNQILYGPPGTGKTYQTIEAAVKAAEPTQYAALDIDEKSGATVEQRKHLTLLYQTLTDEGRIRFVTFHQSYGYEEFVEGLKARETADGGVTYATEDGVFKSICDDASPLNVDTNSGINLSGNVWKISIEATKQNHAKTYCLANNLAAIGWGGTGDLSYGERNDYFESQGKNNKNSLSYFSKNMTEGDIVLCIDSNTSVEAIGVVTGEYNFIKGGLPSRKDYCHQLPVNWLAKEFSIPFKQINGNKQFNPATCYPLHRLSVEEVLKHLLKHGVSFFPEKAEPTDENYVLIIDEINRGNISKIFGELITLIEPSKRTGSDNTEALTVTLPHSGKPFSVPDNLYLIGTMNTADRSLAMMDTALRRRFDFVEMMPKPELFKDKLINGIKLDSLLKKMNDRIEVLYDREHTLGHAFFIPVIDKLEFEGEKAAFKELQNVFKNKIIPLLEEYFFEDWNKIRLVLGDNRKPEGSPLIFVKQKVDTYENIFGANHGLETYEDNKTTYTLTDFNYVSGAWHLAEAYKAIYDHTVLSKPSQDKKDKSENTDNG